MLIVQKFGGSSLAGLERLGRAAEICRGEKERGNELAVVVSAMGDTTDELSALAGEISPAPQARELDALMSTGEQQSAALMALMLSRLGVKGRSYTGWQAGICTDSAHGCAEIADISTRRLRDALSSGITPVVCGFQGITKDGDITTLGRGGSDTTAVALACALGADVCDIYTDVKGIYTADPRLVPGARLLEKTDFRDMLALAERGCQVLHPRCVRLAADNGMPVRLRSSFEPETQGTLVCRMAEKDRPALCGVTAERETGLITLAGRAADADALSELARRLSAEGIQPLTMHAEKNRVCVQVEMLRMTQALNIAHGMI